LFPGYVKNSGYRYNINADEDGNIYYDPCVICIFPDFSLSSLEGNELTRNTLKGKEVILYFWATWAPTCRKGTHHLVELYEKYHKQELGGYCYQSRPGGKEDVAQFAKQNRITYDFPQEVNNAIPKNFGGISSIPTMIILSQEVEIVFKAGGQCRNCQVHRMQTSQHQGVRFIIHLSNGKYAL